MLENTLSDFDVEILPLTVNAGYPIVIKENHFFYLQQLFQTV